MIGASYVTYQGATWGKIIDVLMKCKCMNPVMFYDELDKVSDTHRGEEIINILIHLTDAAQNDKFNDKYL
jgi:ATP-dependent Lon protease